MKRMKQNHYLVSVVVVLVGVLAPRAVYCEEMRGRGLAIELDRKTGRLEKISNLLTQETFQVNDLGVEFETTAGTFRTDASAQDPPGVTVFPKAKVGINYQLAAKQDFFEKIVTITNTGDVPFTIHKVTPADVQFTPQLLRIQPHHDPNIWNKLINLFLHTEKGGFYCGVENPVFEDWSKGSVSGSTTLTMTYKPNWLLRPGETFSSDPFYLGAYKNEEIYCFRELKKLEQALGKQGSPPSFLNMDQEILDWGAIWAMSDFMRAIMPAHEPRVPGFYVRAVAMVGGSTKETWGDSAAFHIAFDEKHVEGSKHFVDQIEKLGHIPHIEWATEWYGVGGYSNPTPDLILEKAGTGDPVPVNPYWQQVVDYARTKDIATGIFETVIRNFAMDQPDLKVQRVDGTDWTWSNPGATPINCWANKDYADWRLQVTEKAVRDQNLYMVAWDCSTPAYWASHGFPQTQTECYNPSHGHPPGDVSYYIYRNITEFLDQLQQDDPRLSLRVACGTTWAYPWILKNLIEYHPNLYDGEIGSTYWMSYNFRFLPLYKSGLLLSATTRENFEYLLLRSIANSDHFMLWPDAVPIALENKLFWDEWLGWADQHIDYLRTGRTLFREPWGDSIVASLPPALEGGLPAKEGSIHGVSHCIGDNGYVFLFNPTDAPRVAELPVNNWLGLTEGDQFAVSTLYPVTLKCEGVLPRGAILRVPVAPRQAAVLRLNADAVGEAPQISIPANAPIDKAFLKWNEIPWDEIMVP